jgi:hypothetical protein
MPPGDLQLCSVAVLDLQSQLSMGIQSVRLNLMRSEILQNEIYQDKQMTETIEKHICI